MRLMIVALCALLAVPRAALAAPPIIVGDGTAISCTQAALQNALHTAEIEGGGTIRFQCGAAPVTIAVHHPGEDDLITNQGHHLAPAALTIPNNTTIDGGGLITLDGIEPITGVPNGTTAVHVAQGSQVVLTGVSITGACDSVVNEGTLALRDSMLVDSSANNCTYLVFGIFNEGTLTVTNSTFSRLNDKHSIGTGITNWGTATITNSEFVDLRGGTAGAVYNAGSLRVKNSVFSANSGECTGGISSVGVLSIDNTEFSRNGGSAICGVAAAVLNFGGSLSVKNSSFSDHRGAGPTIYNSSTTVTLINNCEFSNNFNGGSRGGAIRSESPLIIEKSTFSGNQVSGFGGAIYTSSTLTITGSTITENTANDGGGIYVVGGIAPILIKTTVSGNTPNDIVIQP
jgi:predicted outer membrane repeat protein